jgi:hypothetical protein
MYGDPPLGTTARPWPMGYKIIEGYNDNPEWCSDATGLLCYHGIVAGSIYIPEIDDTVMDYGAADATIEDPANTFGWVDGRHSCSSPTTNTSSVALFRYPRDTDQTTTTRGGDYTGQGCYRGGVKVGQVGNRHTETYNGIFIDGHVKSVRKSQPNQWTRYQD